ncbi:MAG: hypothetical protein IJX78_05505 [Bacilli bacterium]|nr:hypothetical protein [Bacilli bacterium]
MFEFSYNISDVKNRIKEVSLSQSKPAIVMLILFGILAIYFMLIGLFGDSKYLIHGISSLVACVFLICVIINVHNNAKKAIKLSFEKNAENGIIKYVLEKNDELYKVTCKKNGKVIEFKKSDIIKIYLMKNHIIIKYKPNTMIDFPKKQEIIDIFR